MKILIWQERLHLCKKGKFKPWLHLKLRLQGSQNGVTLNIYCLAQSCQCIFSWVHLITCLIEDPPNTTRRLLNWSYFSFAAIRSRSKNNSSWSIRCGVVWRIFSNKQKKTIGAVICVLRRTNSQCKLTRMRSRFDLRTHPIYLGNTKRRLLNSSYFSFAAIRSRSKTTHHCQ